MSITWLSYWNVDGGEVTADTQIMLIMKNKYHSYCFHSPPHTHQPYQPVIWLSFTRFLEVRLFMFPLGCVTACSMMHDAGE